MEQRRRGKLAELRDLWHEFLHPPSNEKRVVAEGRSKWKEDKREDRFVGLVFSVYEKVLPFIYVVDPIEYYKYVRTGDSNPRSGKFQNTTCFPLKFVDEYGKQKAIVWNKFTLLKPTFKEYLQSVSNVESSYRVETEHYFEIRNWDGRYAKCQKPWLP